MKITKKDKLIYEHIADKTLSFGCMIEEWLWCDGLYNCQVSDWIIIGDDYIDEWHQYRLDSWIIVHEEDLHCCWKILWHEPHIGNCLKFIEENTEFKDAQEGRIHNFLLSYKNKSETLMHPDNIEAKEYMITLIEWQNMNNQ